ncbi:MAG: MoxR family ATPase [Planctomycetota bacterium]
MRPAVSRLYENIRQVIIGKDEIVRMSITALLARGHLLIEDVPGLGKTMLARAIAQSLAASFKRIQCTPDLMPTDVTGVSVYRQQQGSFDFVPGPVFAQVLLADEINRATPRTQSSLLEAMEERQVTVEGDARALPEPFFVVATQNPIELTGTFPLPEAQVDRFLMQLRLGYPDADQEVEILTAQLTQHPVDSLQPVLAVEELRSMQQEVRDVTVVPEVLRYIVDLSAASRRHSDVELGISPRGSLALMRSAQALAFVDGAPYVTPDHVKAVAPAVLGHRLVLRTQRRAAGDLATGVIDQLLDSVAVPTLPQEEGAGEAHAAEA